MLNRSQRSGKLPKEAEIRKKNVEIKFIYAEPDRIDITLRFVIDVRH